MRLVTAAVAVVALLVVGCGDDDPESSGSDPADTTAPETSVPAGGDDSTEPAGAGTFFAELDGSQEVPGPGSDTGSGSATLTFGPQFCYSVSVAGLGEDPVAAHIHSGGVGESGPPVITLDDPQIAGDTASYTGCVDPDPSYADAMQADPSGYYVNVHTASFPDGAVRGNFVVE